MNYGILFESSVYDEEINVYMLLMKGDVQKLFFIQYFIKNENFV